MKIKTYPIGDADRKVIPYTQIFFLVTVIYDSATYPQGGEMQAIGITREGALNLAWALIQQSYGLEFDEFELYMVQGKVQVVRVINQTITLYQYAFRICRLAGNLRQSALHVANPKEQYTLNFYSDSLISCLDQAMPSAIAQAAKESYNNRPNPTKGKN